MLKEELCQAGLPLMCSYLEARPKVFLGFPLAPKEPLLPLNLQPPTYLYKNHD